MVPLTTSNHTPPASCCPPATDDVLITGSLSDIPIESPNRQLYTQGWAGLRVGSGSSSQLDRLDENVPYSPPAWQGGREKRVPNGDVHRGEDFPSPGTPSTPRGTARTTLNHSPCPHNRRARDGMTTLWNGTKMRPSRTATTPASRRCPRIAFPCISAGHTDCSLSTAGCLCPIPSPARRGWGSEMEWGLGGAGGGPRSP